MTFILDMVSGKVCEEETLYCAPRKPDTEKDKQQDLHMERPNLQLALVEPLLAEEQSAIVTVGLDMASLLDIED
jgi:hypothetical protein